MSSLMARSPSNSPFARCLAAILVLLLAFAGAAHAKKKKEEEDKRDFTVTEPVGKKLLKAQEAMGEEQWVLAVEALEPLERKADKGRLKDYERAVVYQFLSLIAASQLKYEVALEYMEKAIAQEALPRKIQLSIMYNVAQVHLATEKYPDAVTALKRWFRNTDERTPAAYYLLAVSYYQQSLFDKALRPAKKAVDIAKKPNQAWLQMLVGLHLQEERYAEALPHVEVLAANFPKKIYYTQLSALYAQLGNDEKSLAVMQLAYQQGFLTLDRELVRLGEMYYWGKRHCA